MSEQDQRDDEKPHGDPLLASAQGRNDGDDGNRHGWSEDASEPVDEEAGPER